MDLIDVRTQLEDLHKASYGWALACCGRDSSEAEDVVQTVYVKILEGKAVFRGESSLKTWMFALIRNTAADRRRTSLLRRLKIALLSNHAPERHVVEHPDDVIQRSETRAFFLKSLGELPRRQREVLQLVFYHDLTIDEAARVMGVSVGSVRQHYDRGKRRLRDALETSETSYVRQYQQRAPAEELR